MKNTLLKTKLFLMAICAVVIVSCSGDDGDDGAMGPQGIAGIDGQDGINGTNGTDGEDGNANVNSILLQNRAISIGDNDFSMPQLTQEILDNGAVLAYIKGTGNFWQPLPLIQGGNISLDIDRLSLGNIRLTSTFTAINLNLRFIIIKSNFTGVNAKMNYSQMTYEEVMNYFGLKD